MNYSTRLRRISEHHRQRTAQSILVVWDNAGCYTGEAGRIYTHAELGRMSAAGVQVVRIVYDDWPTMAGETVKQLTWGDDQAVTYSTTSTALEPATPDDDHAADDDAGQPEPAFPAWPSKAWKPRPRLRMRG